MDDFRKYTAEECGRLRAEYLRERALPIVQRTFDTYPVLRSAFLAFAQFWNDAAEDEVLHAFFYSELETPNIDAAFAADRPHFVADLANTPTLTAQPRILASRARRANPGDKAATELEMQQSFADLSAMEYEAIPLWAAYCKESGNQDANCEDNYSPVAIFRRAPDGIDVEFIGHMHRPWLDGVMSSHDAATDGEEPRDAYYRMQKVLRSARPAEPA